MADNGKININYGIDKKDGLGLNMQLLFKGLEGLLQSKTVVGEPIQAGDALIIPLLEISAGLATGALQNDSHNNGAGGMSAKMSPVAMLIIQDDRIRLVNVRNQDIFTRLVDLIPEAVDKITHGSVSESIRKKAQSMTDPDNIELVEPEVILPEN